MCLRKKENQESFIAQKDIVCYKILRKGYISPFLHFRYKKGIVHNLYNDEIVEFYNAKYKNEVNVGFHSYKSWFKAYLHLLFKYSYKGCRIVKFIIPKGACAYKGTWANTKAINYCSNKIIMK